MKSLIPIINQLQDVFNTIGVKGINLPQIVVVGSQSAGKSSVLESIVGRDFLPRGSGMVTKRPLILQLVNLPSTETTEWGEFAHKPGIVYRDFEEIKKEIENETIRLTGTKKTISPVAIRLKIYSPYVVDLTLVDLPGLTKISVGSQEKDISNQLKQMVLKFIESPNAIILAVTSANVDLATSDALSIAREVDPNGDRTIGVLTKMDIMDKGTDAMDVLYGRVYPLKLGYVGVLNRSQHDIDTNVSIKTALIKEKEWFSNHPIYSKIADRLGIPYLTKTLNEILMQHILKTLPSLRITITEMLNKTKLEYNKFAVEFDQKDVALLEKIIEYCTSIQQTISGEKFDIEKHELFGGAKIFDIFENVYRPIIDKLDLIKEISDKDIKTAMKNTEGVNSALFLSQAAFETLVKQQIDKFIDSSQQCVDKIRKEMSNIFTYVASEVIVRYTKLRDAIVIASDTVLDKNLNKTHEIVKNLIDIEESYINTVHPDFDATEIMLKAGINEATPANEQNPTVIAQAPPKPIPQPSTKPPKKQSPSKTGFWFWGSKASDEDDDNEIQKQTTPSIQVQPKQQLKTQPIEINTTDTREQRNIMMMRELTKSYLNIVKKSVEDFVPKAIMHFLINQTCKDLQKALIEELYKSDKITDLMSESPAITTKREMLKKNLEALQTAYNVLEGIVTIKVN
ncbi:dynamin, putative [Entamoeba dispar SAW760]|uniref:Dynamin, putative n=1 Tax=Entamoeba dispar (strain ATCC PRA-260 / SAW760) TaxID=370354 RepID=B0E6L6_ENTDS|nr:dynamin, putative [Entamoeba dispar SAW760]EDR29849.1 dynamin, putative [Entamoeba dispar SAW760]|eukprot:EDR29849.1 dynamin, putative [Entamoeba dispar SAW760]